jgi:hypothetical protein
MKISLRSAAPVGEAGIDPGDLKWEAGTPKRAKNFSSFKFRNNEHRYEHRQQCTSIKPY